MTAGRICSRAGGSICTSCGSSCRLDNKRRVAKRKANGTTTAHWERLRAAALIRDSGRCRLQLPGCTVAATTVHLDQRFGGDHARATLSDVLSACPHCHGVIDGPRASLG